MAHAVLRQDPQFVLTLSQAEAQTLLDVLWNIGGWDGQGGHRERLDEINEALITAGLVYSNKSILRDGVIISDE